MAGSSKPTVQVNPDSNIVIPAQSGQSVLNGGNYVPLGATSGNVLPGAKPGLTRAESIPTTTTETQQADYTTTQFVTNQIFQEYLGRNATPDEVQKYYQAFNAYAATHPVFTRTAVYQMPNAQGQTVTGLSPLVPSRDITAMKNPLSINDFISNMVQQNPEADAFNMAKNYMESIRTVLNQAKGSL